MKTQAPETTNVISAVVARARELWHAAGGTYTGAILTESRGNAKLEKSDAANGTVSAGISLWPGRAPSPDPEAPDIVTCAHATDCAKSCIAYTGHATAFPLSVLPAKLLRTWLLIYRPDEFHARVDNELAALRRRNPTAQIFARWNITSDFPWHMPAYRQLPQRAWERWQIRSYGYTKVLQQLLPHHRLSVLAMSEFYRLCPSRSEGNGVGILDLISSGVDVACVFHERGNFGGRNAMLQRLPSHYALPGSPERWRVIDGDVHDIRGFYDPPNRGRCGRIIGLRLKGDYAHRQEAIDSGFSLPVS